jgi:hypothetical protein
VAIYADVGIENAVGVWLLDEGRGDLAEDISGNGHDGQITGADWVDGKFGEALEFEGNGEVRIDSTEKLQLGDQLTMMAYFYTKALNDWHQMIAKDAEYLLRIDPPGEGTRMSAFVNLAGGWEPRASSRAPEKEVWIHFAAVYDGDDGILKVYVDGVPSGQSARVSKPNPGNAPVTFGHWNNSSRFVGMLDDLAIFNAALEEADIMDIATDGLEHFLALGGSVQPSGKIASTWGFLKK